MRLAIFGGSFNPIHAGHVGIAEKALVEWQLDKILFLPAHISPFKLETSGTAVAGGFSDAARWELVTRVCARNPKFEAWDLDLRRGGVSYAIDTVRAARARFPDAEVFWIVGEDSVAGLPRWKDWETLRTLCHFISYPRSPESSTEIRRRLVAGESIADLVPADLVEFYHTVDSRPRNP